MMRIIPSYRTVRIVPIADLPAMDRRYLSQAIRAAEESLFDSSHRVGACLVQKGQCILPGSKHQENKDRPTESELSTCRGKRSVAIGEEDKSKGDKKEGLVAQSEVANRAEESPWKRKYPLYVRVEPDL